MRISPEKPGDMTVIQPGRPEKAISARAPLCLLSGMTCKKNEEEYDTLLEILDDAGEAWSKGQTSEGRSAPFHVVFVIAEEDKSKRKHWELEEFSAIESETPKTKPNLGRSTKRPRK